METHVKVAVAEVAPFAMFHEGYDPDKLDGIDVLIMKHMAAQLNFTVKYLLFKHWGNLMPNGSWVQGMVAAVASGEADVGIGIVQQSVVLYKSMDFGPTYSMCRVAFSVRRPEQIEFQWKKIMSIFQPVVWVSTFATLILIVVINKKILDLSSRRTERGWQESIMTVLGIFFSTNFFMPDSRRRTRWVLTVWSVFCLLLTASLSSGIVTKLTLPSYTARVDTLQQLVEQGFYWTSQAFKRINTTAARDYLFSKNNVWSRRYMDRYQDLNVDDVTSKVENDRKITMPFRIEGNDLAVFFPGESVAKSVLRTFRFLKEPINQDYVSFGLNKHFPFSKKFAVAILRFQEVGLIQHWRGAVLRRYPEYDTRHMFEEHDEPAFKGPQPLPLQKMYPLLFLLIAGYFVATFVFAFEYLIYNHV